MNETEKEQILRMLEEGTLTSQEAAQLLALMAAPAPETESASGKKKPVEAEKPAEKQLMEIQMQRPDGTYYTVKVPPGLGSMIWEVTKATVREQARTAAKESWEGFKTIVSRKTDEVKQRVKDQLLPKSEPEEPLKLPKPPLTPEQIRYQQARQQILILVRDALVTVEEAGRLLDQLEANLAFEKTLAIEA